MANFILIHGAWHGPWCWYKLTPLLKKAGHKVIEIDLANVKSDKITIKDYVDYLEYIINREDEKPIILGHSMAGIILSSLNTNNIKLLIYLSAFILDNESIIDIANNYPSNHLELEFEDNFKICLVKENCVKESFYNKSSPDDVAYATQRLKSQQYNIFTQKIIDIKSDIKKYYIKCIFDNVITINAQEYMIKNHKLEKIYSLDSDHSPFFSDTSKLLNILNEIASIE